MSSVIFDNEINLEVYNRLNGLTVDGVTCPLYVSKVTSEDVKNYYLINTQLNLKESTKCGDGWDNSTEIQVVSIEPLNVGSKKMLNNMTNAALVALSNFDFAAASVNEFDINVENELVENTNQSVVYRKILRLRIKIN